VTDREDVVCESIQHTRVQTCLTLCDESNSGFAFVGVRYEISIYRSPAHLALLGSFPSVRVRQDELDVILDGFPHSGATGVTVDDEGPGAAEEISEEVAKHFDRGFRFRQMREPHAVHLQLHGFGTKTELEASAWMTVRGVYLVSKRVEGRTARPLSILAPRRW
jgi:hypothetical protein